MHTLRHWLLPLAALTPFAAAQTLVKDINSISTNSGSNAANMVDTGLGYALLAANGGTGTELWRTNALSSGTTLVLDINSTSATASSSPSNFFTFAGRTYFSATDGTNGTELWSTNGTAAGTAMVKDINVGTGSSFPGSFTLVGPLLLFAASNGTTAGVGQGTELWITDGTAVGTTLVADINPLTASSSPSNFAVLNGYAYFSANNGSVGTELWRSDGTTVGTTLFLDINVTLPTASSSPLGLASIGSNIWFRANDGVVGSEVWTTDGTVVGTSLLTDIRVGAGNSLPSAFNPVGSRVAFVADDGTNGGELWISDGTMAGTTLLLDINPGIDSGPLGSGDAFAVIGSTLYFSASNGNAFNGYELWKTDGTPAGTVMVKDINPGTAGSTSAPMIAFGANLVFAAQDSSGMELWISDGTMAGTTLLLDINPIGNSAPNSLAVYGSRVLFSANDGFSGTELWRTDGTSVGTALVLDINPPLPTTAASNPTGMTAYGNLVIFAANDGLNGTELWRTDGTAMGTFLLKDITPGSSGSSPANFYVINGGLMFTALNSSGSELWRTDGTAAGTVMVKDLNPGNGAGVNSTATAFAVLNGILYFSGNDGSSGPEPARSDGTAAGTYVITDLNLGTTGSAPGSLLTWSGRVYMQATNGATGAELFATDGTAGGTVLVKDVRTGTLGSSPTNFTAASAGLFFTANEGTTAPETGTELWITDGTTAGTTLVRDINPNTASSSPSSLFTYGGTLFFAANDGTNGIELWSSDGSLAGTALFKNINPGNASSSPTAMGTVNGKLVFRATDGALGNEIYVSDGSPAGTVLLLDMWSGSSGGFFGSTTVLASAGNRVLFCGNSGTTGSELWFTDGTAAGTQALFDLNPGATNGVTGPLVRVFGNRAYFVGTDGVTGSELWSIPLRLYGGAVVEPFGTGCPGTSNIVPQADASGTLPLLGSTFNLRAVNGRPVSPCVLLLAPVRNDLTIGTCTLYPDLGSSVSFVLGTDAVGGALAPLPIPPVTALLGVGLVFQWAVADPAGQFLGITSLTNGLYAVIGAP